MAARPYNHPDNLKPNGQPKMSETAWAIYEQLREDMHEDADWGSQLFQALATKAGQADIQLLASFFSAALKEKADKNDVAQLGNLFLDSQNSHSLHDLCLAISALSTKLDIVVEALKAHAALTLHSAEVTAELSGY